MKKKTILFRIVKREPIELEDNTLDFIRKFPTHYQMLSEAKEIFIILEYTPVSSLDETKYLEAIKEKLKHQYNAYSITYGEPQQQINQ